VQTEFDPETDRLGRLVEAELGECCAADVSARREELAALAERTPDAHGDHRPALAALANPTRYRLARLLVESREERCLCELAPLVEVGESSVSRALGDLVEAGLAERREAGKWRYYRSTPAARLLVAALDAGL
jgi:DNA-binding transcriptional ArsR family regulator